MRKISKDDYFELYVFLMDYHSGQWSRGYRLLCRLGVTRITDRHIEECRKGMAYEYLVDNYANKV